MKIREVEISFCRLAPARFKGTHVENANYPNEKRTMLFKVSRVNLRIKSSNMRT